MKTTIAILLLAATAAIADPPPMIQIPWATDSNNATNFTRTNLPAWWNGGTNFYNWTGGTNFNAGVAPWMAWQAAWENWRQLTNWMQTNGFYLPNLTTLPAIGGSDGLLVNSNKVLYWITATQTNLVSNGQ